MLGNVLTAVAVPWFVLETTGSATKTGIAGAVIVLPTIIAGIFGGALVDRLGYRRMSIASDLASGLTVAMIPTLNWSIGITFWQLLALMFLSALLDVPGATARQSMIPEIASAAGMELGRANSNFSSISRAAQLSGPILAGLLIAQIGASALLWIDAATFAISALIVAVAVPSRDALSVSADDNENGTGYLREVVEGFATLRRDRLLLVLLVSAALVNFITNPMTAVALPVYASEVFDSAALLGVMLAGFGGGAMGGAVLYGVAGRYLSRRVVFVGGLFGGAVPIAVLGLLPNVVVTVMALTILGIATGPLTPIFATVVQERTPAAMRGRVFGLISASVWIVLPIGMLVTGLLIERIGLRATFLAQGAVFALLATALLASPVLHAMDEK